MSRGETCCKMAPSWSRTLVRCSAFLVVLQAFLHVTSATDVVGFDQSRKSENDNIYDILEDEQFFIVDKKLSKGKQKVQVPAVFNLTAPGVHHSKQSTLVDKNLVETTTESVRTTAAPIVHHSGITSHANAVGDEGEFENDLVDDFLIFSQDRERVEKMEERRREEEQDLARRVRRQVVEGTGVSSVNAEVTVDRQWISNYSDPSTNEFTTLQSQSETSLTNQLSSLPQTTTVAVTGFRQGSVIIEFTVSYPNDDVDRAALARQLLSIRDNGLTLGSNTDTVLGEPELTDGSDTDTLRASTCYLCRSYQTCLLDNSTSHYYCQVSSSDFFTFGRAQKDKTLQNNKERVAKKLKVPGGIPVVDQTVNEVYVSMNGLISFGQRYGAFSPRPLPRRNRQLMCGYWADMQLLSSDSSSSVWYHAYEKTDSNTTEEQTVLNEANNMVALYGDVTGFSASFVLVVTFEEMPPDPTNDDTDERVNFQMVLISDGSITYGMFIYASGAMQWNEALQRRVTIGYLEETFPISSARPDTEIGNTNRPGVWFFTLGQLPEVTENPEQKCLDWYYSNLPNRNSYNAISRLIPTCPCSYTLAFFSNEWIPEDNNGELPKCFVIAPFHGQWGKRCCYTPRLSYERNRPEAGSFLLHHPWVNEAQNYENDVLPKQYCCEQSDLCALYYDVRPTDTCQRFIVIIIAIGRGDPHINTLDGKTFPFNAIGEFTLIKIDLPAQKFDLQARTCQARSSSGDPVAASIFCGFVARGNGSEKFQVELNNNRSGMVIYANDQDLTLTYEQEGNLFNRTIGGLVLRRSNNTIRATFQEGVSINITVEFQLLTIEVGVKETLEGFTGLLGDQNGNPEDDFIFPNGTTLPGNTTERDLLAYGKSWALTSQTSLFRYQAGYNTDSYTNDSFVPIFLSEVNQTLITQAETTCGSSADVGCIFDFIATGDTDLALGTKQASDAAALVKSTADNRSPELDGPARINVTVSNQTTFTLNASDHEDQQQLTYNIISQPAEGFSFDNDTQTGTWTPVNNDTSKIEIAVTDSQGAQSPSLKIEIVLCSGCNGRGTCDFETFRTQVGDEYYKLAVCECEPYYEGDDCENDFDACADEPCPVGTTCTDFTIAEHIAAGADSPGYNCSSCPNGYTYNETVLNCYDIDECAVGNCSQTCTNTVGSFSCGCNLGYRLSPPVTGTDCNDIDECADGTNDCVQTCTNTVGSFTCDCYPGFTLDPNGRTCTKDAATDPCASLTNNCEYACQNQSGVAVCQCPNGYTLADNNYNCTDVDECSQNVCSQLCNNTDGGFVCSCYTGYSLDADQVSCSECTGNTYGVNCNETCECRGRGTCDKVKGCQCNSGWTGTTCSDDVNECVTLAAPCPSGQICSNTNGSYTCSCPTGYRKINITTCEDIDECAAPTLNNCKQVCTNTVGSYTCSCNTGYTYDSATNTCQDIDECATQLSQCEQLCVNYPGSANCECRSGFLLNDDRKTCAKERDPCAVLSDSKNCSYGCEISQSGVATCYCPSGYELAVDEVTCVDINECTNNATNQCSQQCDNAPGSYICSCSIGYRLDNSQRNCTGCDAYHWGEDCANDCNCSPLGTNYCDSVTGCVCKEGWLGTTCELDRDECSSNPCPANAACTDTAGSYRCDCNAGYASNAAANPCDDVNECDDSPCDQTCTNSVGSYVCSCSSGFNSVGDSCVDIDECLSNPCSQICRNTIGGFACECYNGFLLNMTTRTTCYAQTECVSSTCEQNCRVVGGTEKCICNAGYTVNATDSSICDDIDECQNNPCINGTCNNTPGAFTCTCANGTYLLGDDLTCAVHTPAAPSTHSQVCPKASSTCLFGNFLPVCPQESFGQNCASNCTCNTTNTNICEAETGACQCKTGWTGTTCDDNEDECRINSTICDSVPNSSCVDSPGSYSCVCNNGFFTSSGSCYACDDVSWGTECSQTCSCARANTLDCNDTTGACTCNQYWTGDNCMQDINECTVDPCNAALFEVCRNFDGGYSCDCISGYHRPSPGDNCTDLDECLYTNLNTCNRTTEICLNTEGSFVCNCSTGFAANSNGVCDDFDECAANTDACSQTCVNTFGSYTCACNSGYTLNADGITCDDNDECANPSLNNCTDKEDCTNTDGSFSCSCKSGYVRGSLGICIGASTCYLCRSYQKCLLDNSTSHYYCQVSSSDFFTFGRAQKDKTLQNNKERVAKKLKVPGGIPVVDQTVNEVYVSMNGLISFGQRYGAFSPRPLPRRNRQLMCGYWADMQLLSSDSSSSVWYHAYEKTDSNTAEEQTVLNEANNMVALYGDVTGFSASFVLVVTFEEMPPDPTNDDTDERVNFQMVLISDGSITYGMFIYASGAMQWNEALQRRVTIGYLEETFPISSARPDTEIGNTNRPGVWFFTLGQLPEVTENPEQKCLDWYYSNLPNRNSYNTNSGLMPTCPCSYTLAFFSNEWIPEDNNGELPKCFVIAPFYGQWGKRCCYTPRLSYERNRPEAGSFLLHHPWVNEAQNYENDVLPKQYCCEQSDLCALYYDVRPTDTCQRFIVIIIAIGRGDPHINTLDGKTFPFNAIGEFTLIKIDLPAQKFDLQARTCQARSSSGDPVAASIFCGFVARGNGSEKFQVELNNNRSGMVIYANDQDLTLTYEQEGNLFNRTIGGLVLRRSNNTIRATFQEGVSINITVEFQLLTIEVGVKETLEGFTGLLGDQNGNPEDDFIFPNGTTLPGNTTERDLLAYGKSWALTSQTSLFRYQAGYNTDSYTNDSFVPIFLSEVNQTLITQAETTCGSSADVGCIFDFIATGDTDLALGTKQASDAAALVKSTADNRSPELDGPARINVTVSNQTTFTLNASDHEDQQQLTYNIISQPAEGFSFDNDTQTGTWTPVNNNTSKIEIAVTDSQGAQSPSLKIEIVLCSGCNRRGTCDFDTFRTQVGDEYYKLAVCECEPYYEGDDCENDFDACADEPCPVGTTCTDFTIAEHIAAGADSPGYNCSSCPNGYTYNETVLNCYDIDECAVGNCSQTCTNTVGSFSCGCNLGYRLSPPVTGTDCNDIDECADGTNDCVQTCTNTVGSFTCDCYPGFTLDPNGRTCTKDAATDPCASLTNNCEYACQNQSGVAVCQCPNGYTLADNNYNCTDVDECSQNVCSQLCNNTDGGFVCSCYTGYSLDADQVSCSECTGNTYGVNCNETCECRGRGTCDKVKGCQCNSGWTGTTCSDDVNECVTLAAPCPSGQICSNTNGSYTCSCPTGYRKINITTCEDIDECAAPTLNNCKQVCTNTVGSYTCSCNTGYTYDSATNTCQDIDECATQLSQCEQLCINYPGSANCECRSGFLLNDDRKTCAKERDPCAVLSDSKNCSYGCEISQSGVATCYCPSGYELAVDEVTCVDINECTNNATNQCSQQCDNAPGSYICSCSIGYRLDNSQRNCTGCDAYHWGEDCANDCNCSPLGTNYCDSVTGCVCKEGWLGTTCELDRDECSSNPCPANAACTDTAGSYRCDCNAGYASNAAANPCDDVNECDDSPCDQTCTNSVGSYVCSCSSGFNSVGDSCVDIDECLSNPCSQICRNTIGGFACECYNGFLLNMTTRTTCYAQTECVSTTCEQNCRVVGGTEKCICNAGYTVNATDSSICDDVDECQNNPCINGTCTNTPGAFTCTCANGTYLMGDDLTCAVCPQGSFGQNCASNCTCNTTNTNICEAETGACQCKTGWTGTTCDDNEDECRMNSAICDGVPNSSCVDSPGSYSCVCNNGFFTSSGSCYACDDVSWGTECSQNCSCARANTLDCNDTTGACICNQYWTGDNCTQDINECTVDPNICHAALFEVCRNFDGGYSCDCVSGYHRPSPGDNCTDLDECLYTNLNTCNRTTEICLNTEGSFVCNCSTGFAANSNGVCDDFDECAANTDACSQTCVNTFGSYTCACNSGYTLNADGITCDDIDECANPSLNNCTDKEDCTNTDGSLSCSCKSGYVRGSLGICIATYQNYSLTITLDITANEPLTDKATNYYAELLQLIQEALRSFLSGTVGQPFHAVLISDLRSGSVVVDAELQIDASKTTNPEGLAAKGSRDLVQAQSLTVNGTAYAVNAVEYNNATVTQALTVCETFALFKTCAADEVCEEVNGVPQCRVIQEEESDYKLIIGLSVGIPLFFIFAVIIAVLIYMCVKRQREAEQTRPEPSEDRFRSVFASQIPTKGSWGAPHRYQMYSPDTLSDATSESSGEGQLLKGRRQGRTDFQDSAWYDNRGAAAPDGQRGPPRTPRDPAEGATSNFSWEYMFRLLEPYRGFEIQRPAVHSDPNPAFTPRRKRPDSMA